MRVSVAVIAAIVSLGAALGPRYESGRLTDAGARVSVALLGTWELDQTSKSGKVALRDAARGASFQLSVKQEGGEIEDEFKGLKLAVPFLGGKWSKVSERWLTIGGQRAGQLEGVRQSEGAPPLREWNAIAVRYGHAYIFSYSIPDSQAEAGAKELRDLLKTVRWLPKPKT